ncbi:hypothetical protein [Bifidobacterium castoris]|uniref:Uncharacterized protein n=1 Tax=Bifidobacterium castoris TaxID=2306972 RepID=A0A430FAC7_9BIFI|nr:hypothetical protein [Bifidobacterium castoris]RSX49791.1 hypothetical protein D2E22_0252 [Bifidobacterium castoris]
MDDMNLEISLDIGSESISVPYLTRRMTFAANGTVTDDRYTLNPNPSIDWDDGELLRLLDDTLTGMRAEIRHRMRAIRQGAAS